MSSATRKEPDARDYERRPLTLVEVRDALADLRDEEQNRGGDVGRLCRETHAILEWIVHAYLRSSAW